MDNKIHIISTRVKSGAANPAPKLATLIASIYAGADYIDDVDLVGAGGMKTLRPVLGQAKQGASYGHTKIAGKQVLHTGLSTLVTDTARTAGFSGQIIVRGDSASGSRAAIRVCRRYGAVFSLVLTRNADITHRRHAIIETTFADLIDGPPAHIPSGRFGAHSAWAICAAIANNLRAAATLAGTRHRTARRMYPWNQAKA